MVMEILDKFGKGSHFESNTRVLKNSLVGNHGQEICCDKNGVLIYNTLKDLGHPVGREDADSDQRKVSVVDNSVGRPDSHLMLGLSDSDFPHYLQLFLSPHFS